MSLYFSWVVNCTIGINGLPGVIGPAGLKGKYHQHLPHIVTNDPSVGSKGETVAGKWYNEH